MALPSAQTQLDQLNARILDTSFLLNYVEHLFTRILLFRGTLSRFDGTEQIFQTLSSLRTEAERTLNLIQILNADLLARRIVAFRAVESSTHPRPGVAPFPPDSIDDLAKYDDYE